MNGASNLSVAGVKKTCIYNKCSRPVKTWLTTTTVGDITCGECCLFLLGTHFQKDILNLISTNMAAHAWLIIYVFISLLIKKLSPFKHHSKLSEFLDLIIFTLSLSLYIYGGVMEQ